MKIGIIAFSTRGCETAKKAAEALEGEDVTCYAKTSADSLDLIHVSTSTRKWTERAFAECDALVFIGAIGIAVREIAPFLRSKDTDPAVVGIDEGGRFAVPLLSGHIGGANALAIRIAGRIGSTPVVTTATDINGKIAIDAFAATHDLSIVDLRAAKEVASRILAEGPVGFVSDFPVVGDVPPELSYPVGSPAGVYVGRNLDRKPFGVTLRLVPRDRVLGIGCRRGTPEETIDHMVRRAMIGAKISMDSVRAVASIDLKKDEKGLLQFAEKHKLPISFYSADDLNALEGEFSKSEFVRSVTSVDCVCERSAVKASRGGRIELPKYSGDGVTVAIAKEDYSVRFSEGNA